MIIWSQRRLPDPTGMTGQTGFLPLHRVRDRRYRGWCDTRLEVTLATGLVSAPLVVIRDRRSFSYPTLVAGQAGFPSLHRVEDQRQCRGDKGLCTWCNGSLAVALTTGLVNASRVVIGDP
jgi:hypothetical protein